LALQTARLIVGAFFAAEALSANPRDAAKPTAKSAIDNLIVDCFSP
jgi:hypothetical protein